LMNNIELIQSTSCSKNDKLSNKECFNDVLVFDDLNWRAGHSALKKDGTFMLEFSVDSKSGNRLFYGLKPNGRYYFSNDSPTKEITLPTKNYDNSKNIVARYESINSFVSLKNDINKNKEYLLSISTYFCYIEIYDITSESISYDAMYTYPYFGNPIFSFKFDLSESFYKNEIIYYLAFSHRTGEDKYGDKMSVKKISFSSMTLNKDDVASGSLQQDKLNDRTVSSFVVDDVNDDSFKIFVVIYTSSG